MPFELSAIERAKWRLSAQLRAVFGVELGRDAPYISRLVDAMADKGIVTLEAFSKLSVVEVAALIREEGVPVWELARVWPDRADLDFEPHWNTSTRTP